MPDPIVVTFFNNANAPLAGLTPKLSTGAGYTGYYKTAAGLDATPPAVVDGGAGDYAFNPSPADRVTGIRYLIDGGPSANPRFYEGQIDGVPLPVVAPAVVPPIVGKPFDPADPTSIWSASDVNALKAAISSGALSVEYGGPPARRFTYQDLNEMRSLLAAMVSQLRNDAGTRRSYRLASFKSGV